MGVKMKFGLSEEIYIKIKNIIEKYDYTFKVFGSRARGNYRDNSDIDIAIFGNVSNEDEDKIKNDIDSLDIVYTIDLVFINNITKKDLLDSILKEGVEF